MSHYVINVFVITVAFITQNNQYVPNNLAAYEVWRGHVAGVVTTARSNNA